MPKSKKTPEIDINALPLSSLNAMLNDPSLHSLLSLSITLAGMANTGRSDALTMLFGLAFLNRSDLDRMKQIVYALKLLNHPEVAQFLKSEMLRVQSTPTTRSYLRTVLDGLFAIHNADSIAVLHDLLETQNLGSGYKKQIESFLYS